MQHNRKHALRSKGQNIIEYALMLAIIVGIGFLIYSQNNFGQKIQAVFGNANNLLATVEKESDPAVIHDRGYADAMAKMLKAAIAKGTVQLDRGATVGIYAQNANNGNADGYHINGLVGKTGSVTVNGKNYMANGGFYGFWKSVDGGKILYRGFRGPEKCRLVRRGNHPDRGKLLSGEIPGRHRLHQ